MPREVYTATVPRSFPKGICDYLLRRQQRRGRSGILGSVGHRIRVDIDACRPRASSSPRPPPHAGGERVRPGESESGCSGFAPCGRKQPGCLDALQTIPSGRYIDDIVRMYDTVRTSTSGRPTPSLGKTHALQRVEESPYRDSRTHHVRGAGDVQRLRDEPRRPFQSKRRMAASSVPPTQKESRPGVRSQASPSHAGRTALTRALSGAGDRQL